MIRCFLILYPYTLFTTILWFTVTIITHKNLPHPSLFPLQKIASSYIQHTKTQSSSPIIYFIDSINSFLLCLIHMHTHTTPFYPSSPTDYLWGFEGECASWYLTPHLKAHPDLHEWGRREEAVLWHDHPHPREDVLPVVASSSASFQRKAVWVLCMLYYLYCRSMWRIWCTFKTRAWIRALGTHMKFCIMKRSFMCLLNGGLSCIHKEVYIQNIFIKYTFISHFVL